MDDVLICGAGPAGAIAAVVLARAGARVRVLDRAAFPRHKLCGDSLNPGALAILGRLGLASAASTGLEIRGMIVTGEPPVSVTGLYGGAVRGRALPRTVFDAALLRAAEEAGASIEQGVLVREPWMEAGVVRGLAIAATDARSYRLGARVTIAADGSRSRLARTLGIAAHARAPRRWAVGAYFENVDGLTECGEMHVRRGRYIGVAPLPARLANVCVVTADRAALRDPVSLLEQSVRTDPVLRDRFARARRVTPAACLGPLAVECTACGVPGLLLAGDAAGFIDPMTGDGLRFAMRGAELAAEAAAGVLEHGHRDGHVRLADARRREFGAKWRFDRALRSVVSSPAAVGAAARGAAWLPAILRRAIRYAGDVHAA
jgi:flavin-dependent dehydrogenase